MGAYRELAERHRRGELDTSQLRVAQLDEYAGLAGGRPSLALRLDGELVHGAARRAREPHDPARRQAPAGDRLPRLRRGRGGGGGFDLAVLGLGPNGHLGFNEPPIERDAPTRLVPLTPASVRSNARYWGGEDDVPREALTCGLASMLAARQILLVVSGAHKREILRRTLASPPSADGAGVLAAAGSRRRRRARG